MPYVDRDRAYKMIEDKICVACGSKLEKEYDHYICSATNMYPWKCMSCNFAFHLDKKFPTIEIERCPQCGRSIETMH